MLLLLGGCGNVRPTNGTQCLITAGRVWSRKRCVQCLVSLLCYGIVSSERVSSVKSQKGLTVKIGEVV